MSACTEIHCNKCFKKIDPGSQVLTTFCNHCFCLECANIICEGDNSCTKCGAKLEASNVSVEICGAAESASNSLQGCSPEQIIMVVSDALVFNQTQRHITNAFQAKTHKDKCKQIVESSRTKMGEMHASYKNLAQKAKEMINEKAEKELEIKELKTKAQESARVCQKLQEQLQAVEKSLKVMQHQTVESALSPLSPACGALPALQSSRNEPHRGKPFNNHRIAHGNIVDAMNVPSSHQESFQHFQEQSLTYGNFNKRGSMFSSDFNESILPTPKCLRSTPKH